MLPGNKNLLFLQSVFAGVHREDEKGKALKVVYYISK